MAERHRVSIRVVSQQGTCDAHHQVGDEWVIDSIHSPQGICLAALHVLYPSLRVLMFGGDFPWEKESGIKSITACPDGNNPVLFKLKRIPR